MTDKQVKLVIVTTLQQTLAGQLKLDTQFNPQRVADAIIEKINFQQPTNEAKFHEIIETIIDSVETCQNELNDEFEELDQDKEKLLRNFIRGKIIAYQEMIDILNKI